MLAGGAAGAQPVTDPAPAQGASADPARLTAPNAPVTVDADGVHHVMVANKPVPDTAENRARYGKPMSHAGQRTRPAGD